jgi:hypothetical protein
VSESKATRNVSGEAAVSAAPRRDKPVAKSAAEDVFKNERRLDGLKKIPGITVW